VKRNVVVVALALGVVLLGAGLFFPPLGVHSQSAPLDAKSLALEALAELRRARDEAEPAHLSRADSLLERSLDTQSDDNFEAFVGSAALANARHDFSGSVAWARTAIRTNPHNAAPYGLLGDALFELGRHRASNRAYQDMIDIRPDVGSYVRASYAYQFRGETRAAKGAMRLALAAAGSHGEEAAWVRHQLGDIYFGAGRLGKAARQNRIGTKIASGFVPPQVGLAEVAVARGDTKRATAIMERAAAKLPTLEYLVTLGDLYAATGATSAADRAYADAAAKIRSYYDHGVGPDVDFVLFQSDHRIRLLDTLQAARAMHALRPTAPVKDALAWTLHRLGRDEAAWSLARQAASSRSYTNPLFDLHAGLIAESMGHTEEARSYLHAAARGRLQLSPVHVIELRAALRRVNRRP
jgi:tetratricopeptide (TPR) repeat protein